MGALVMSGNEVTDLARRIGYSLGTSASGQMLDGQAIPGGVGIRRAATNLHPHGQGDTANNYGSTFGAGVISVDVDPSKPAPYSSQSIKVTVDGSATGQGTKPTTNVGQAAAAGTNGVGSIRFWGTVGATYFARLRWVHTDATTVDGPAVPFTGSGDWQLLGDALGGTATLAALAVAAGKTGDQLQILVYTATARAESFWLAHPMLEKGQSVVAPYVATSGGATATHAASRVQAPASLLNAAQGWVAMRVRMGWGTASEPGAGAGTPSFFEWQDDASNRLIGFYRESNNTIEMQRKASVGGQSSAISAAQTFNAGDLLTVVFAWDATHTYLSVNGGAFVSAGGGGIPSLAASTIDIGTVNGSSNALDSDVLWFACGTGTLTNADAATIAALWDLTTQPNRRLMPWDFPPASLCSMTYDPRDNGADFFYGAPGVPLLGGIR